MPDYYFTKPINNTELRALRLDPAGLEIAPEAAASAHSGEVIGTIARRSSRLRGMDVEKEAEAVVAADDGEKGEAEATTDQKEVEAKPEDPKEAARSGKYETIGGVEYKVVQRRQRSMYKRRKKSFKLVTYYVAPNGIEFTRDELCGDEVQGSEVTLRRSGRKQEGERLQVRADDLSDDASTIIGGDEEKENASQLKRLSADQARVKPSQAAEKRHRSLSPNSKLNIPPETPEKLRQEAEAARHAAEAKDSPRRSSPRVAKQNAERQLNETYNAARKVVLDDTPQEVIKYPDCTIVQWKK